MGWVVAVVRGRNNSLTWTVPQSTSIPSHGTPIIHQNKSPPPHAFKKKILGGQPLMDCHHLSGPAVESTSLTVWASGPFGFLESHGQHFIFLWRIENKKLNDSQMPRNVLYTKGGATPRWTTVGHIDTIDIHAAISATKKSLFIIIVTVRVFSEIKCTHVEQLEVNSSVLLSFISNDAILVAVALLLCTISSSLSISRTDLLANGPKPFGIMG